MDSRKQITTLFIDIGGASFSTIVRCLLKSLMCAETLPWRCDRSLIADALMVRGIPVTHLFKPGDSREHRLTGWAQVQGDKVTYPAPEEG